VAGSSRSVEFDLLVSGTEVGGRKLERLGDKFDDLRDQVKRLDGATARIKGIAKLEKDSDRLGGTMAKLSGHALEAVGSVVRVASAFGVAAGAAGPLALGVVAASAAVAQFVASVAPAAAALAPLAAGLVFTKLVLKGFGPAMTAALAPISTAFDRASEASGKLASRGLRPLAREFVKVNFPAVRAAMDRIAESTNKVVTGFGKWLNSTPGQRTIAKLTADVAATFERLAPSVRGVVQSLVEMSGRVSGTAFKTFGDTAEFALTKLNGLIDGIGAGDVQTAFDKFGRGVQAVVAGFRAIGAAAEWLERNRQKVLAFSDAMLVVGGVGAAIVGGPTGWLAALGASLLLLARHWDDVTAAVQRVRDWFSQFGGQVSSTQGTVEALRGAWDRIKDGFASFVSQIAPKLTGYIDTLKVAFIKIQPALMIATEVLGRWYQVLFKVAGFVGGQMIDAVGRFVSILGDLALAAAMTAAKVLSAFADLVSPIAKVARALKLPFADTLQSFVDGARNASSRINTSMAQVKTDLARAEIGRLQRTVSSLKGKTVKTEADRRAIAESQARIRTLQGQINAMHGRNLFINIRETTFRRTVDIAHDRGEHRAAGGPVEAGRPYVVGEHRPELFVPNRPGRIVPRVPAGWNGGRGGATIVTVNLPNYIGPRDEMVREIRAAVRKRGGGDVQRAFGR
jgi:hypothetical protein